MKYSHKLPAGAISLGLVLIPHAEAQGITDIRLQTAPNAIAIEWNAPGGIDVDHYRVYYAHESILENNGRFEDGEDTLGDETTITLFDLANRGFSDGDTIFIAVTAVDEAGKEHTPMGERSATVTVIGALQSRPRSQPQLHIQPPPIPLSDVIPPEDSGNLELTPDPQPDGSYAVYALWDPSPNTAGDLLSYNLYESADHGASFVGPIALRATVLSTTIANVPPGSLTVKLTAMDHTGNESHGTVKTVNLPETGGAALMLSLAGALAALRRRIRR